MYIIIIIIIFTGCAYFNVFYNADKYYNLGIKPIEENKNPNTQYLDKAIEKSSKILEFHPNSKYVDDALMIIGKSYMYKGEYTKAIRKFTELLTYYDKSPFIDEAVFFTAKTYMLQEEYGIARVYLQKLIDQKSIWKEKAIFELSDIYLVDEEIEAALGILNDNNADVKNKNLLKFKKAALYYAVNDFEQASNSIKSVKSESLPKEMRFEYAALYTSILLKMEKYEEALTFINNNIKYYISDVQKNSLLLLKAKIMKKLGKEREAIGVIDDIIAQARNVALKDSLIFEKGLILEQYINDLDGAKESYQIIVNEMKTSPLLPEAEMKIMSIDLLNALQNDTILDDDKISKNRFLLAEINYLTLKRIEEAITLYEMVKDSYSESYYAPKALYALSYICLKEKADTAMSIEYLNKIISKYGHSDIYEEACNQIKRIEDEHSVEE